MILATGAGGFVGAHLLKRLSVLGCSARALVWSCADTWRLRGVAGSFCRSAMTDAASLKPAMQGVEQVIHLTGIFREGWRDL